MEPIDKAGAREAAIQALRRAATPHGFIASASDDHYRSIWARDGCIATLGAIASGDTDLHRTGVRTLLTLASCARPNGQIPNTVRVRSDGLYRDWHENGAIDSVAWYAVAAAHALDGCSPDEAGTLLDSAAAAIRWLRNRDQGGMGVLWVPPAGEWMDSTLHLSGRTLLTNSLFVWALRLFEPLAGNLDLGPGLNAEETAATVRSLLWPPEDLDPATLLFEVPEDLRKGWPHPVLAAVLRNAHDPGRRWFGAALQAARMREELDVLGNCIAVLAGVATDLQTGLILDALDNLAVSEPFATRSLGEPVDPDDPAGLIDPFAESVQAERWRNPPYRYHNAGAWPFIGGFHAWALRSAGRMAAADRVETAIGRTNLVEGAWAFPEWVAGDTGAPSNTRMQTWSAAAALYAGGLPPPI